MPPADFATVCRLLATEAGGYTLWVGAGAAKAVASVPTWAELTDGLLAESTSATPEHWSTLEMPGRLEYLSNELGHARFRMRLRERLLVPMCQPPFDWATAVHQAMIGSRASAVVCFNLDRISGMLFGMGHGGNVAIRTYLPPRRQIVRVEVPTQTGLMSCPVYFPHGLIDEGNCVMTASEYVLHRMTMAAQISVSLCLGGDLLVLGMSLADRYLRDALIEHRAFIRDVYWVTNSDTYRSWARTAGVTIVRAGHCELWPALATTIAESDPELKQRRDILWKRLRPGVESVQSAQLQFPDKFVRAMTERLDMLIATTPDAAAEVARVFEDLGLQVPQAITAKAATATRDEGSTSS